MKHLILSFLAFAPFLLSAQQLIDKTKVEYTIDANSWTLVMSKMVDNYNTKVYKRTAIQDSFGMMVVSYFSIITEPVNPKMTPFTFSNKKRNSVPFKVDKVLTHERGNLGLENAIGYIGTYKDKNGIKHVIYIVHAIYDGYGIQIIGDASESIKEEFQIEMIEIINSFRYLDKAE